MALRQSRRGTLREQPLYSHRGLDLRRELATAFICNVLCLLAGREFTMDYVRNMDALTQLRGITNLASRISSYSTNSHPWHGCFRGAKGEGC